MKITIAILAVLFLAPAGAFAQRLDISHLERLAERADEAINVDIDDRMLKLFGSFIPEKDKETAAAKQFVSGLKGIFVRSFEFGREKAYSPDDVATIRKQLAGKSNWVRMVTVDKKSEGQNVDVFFWMDDDKIGGLAVIVAEATKLTVVNIVGPIDPSRLIALSGQYGIPELPKIEAPPADKKE